MTDETRILPPHGGYQKLKSYQMSEIVYDATVRFCEHYLDKRSRTVDQMVQAARSGKQNIVEESTPEVAVNTIICIIHQTNYLLDQQLRQLEKQFLQEGGITERLCRARTQTKRKS